MPRRRLISSGKTTKKEPGSRLVYWLAGLIDGTDLLDFLPSGFSGSLFPTDRANWLITGTYRSNCLLQQGAPAVAQVSTR